MLPGEAVALADAEIVDGPDVEAAQLEHQVHLRGPAADAADGGRAAAISSSSLRLDVRVRTTVPSSDLRGEVAQRRELVRRQAGRRAASSSETAFSASGVSVSPTVGAHAAVDRLRRAAGELLEDDRAHERGERPVRVARAVADRPDARDEVGEDGIARCDLVDRRLSASPSG